MLSDIDKGWLAGIIDGEGYIGARIVNKGKYSTAGSICIRVVIEATSTAMIQNAVRLYDILGISYKLYLNSTAKLATKPSHKLTVGRRNDVLQLLMFLEGCLVVKKDEASLVIAFAQKYPPLSGRGTSGRPSDEEKLSLVENVKILKKYA